MMDNVTRLPIRRRGAFELAEEWPHTSVGTVEILVARIVTASGPLTFGIILRAPGKPDALACSIRVPEPEKGYGDFLNEMLSTVTGTLRHAQTFAEELAQVPTGPLSAA